MDTSPEALRRYTAHDRLLDGHDLLVRAICPDDKRALEDGLHRLTPESAYFRFFRPKHDLSPQELVYFTEVDFEHHVALVAVVAETQLVVGVGRYIVGDSEAVRAAEIAFAVDDAYHGLGIATILLRHLTDIARAAGISHFHASVLSQNHKMLDVFSHSGLPQERAVEEGVVEVRLLLGKRAPAA
jgi:GNAT superfamily N-acetyltransferase